MSLGSPRGLVVKVPLIGQGSVGIPCWNSYLSALGRVVSLAALSSSQSIGGGTRGGSPARNASKRQVPGRCKSVTSLVFRKFCFADRSLRNWGSHVRVVPGAPPTPAFPRGCSAGPRPLMLRWGDSPPPLGKCSRSCDGDLRPVRQHSFRVRRGRGGACRRHATRSRPVRSRCRTRQLRRSATLLGCSWFPGLAGERDSIRGSLAESTGVATRAAQ